MLQGRYRPGTVLRDTDLAEKFDVARPTARAAVQALVAAGLLERPRGRSARVPQIGRSDVVDLFSTRYALEIHAIERIISEDRPLDGPAEALAELESFDDSVGWDRIADADVAFHQAVISAADSVRLGQLFATLATELRLMVALLRPAYPEMSDLVSEHRQLFDALQSRDLDRCRTRWRGHFDSAVAEIIYTTEDSSIEGTPAR
jgi:DNA-binding GntR family transcriptional regulator